MTSIVEKKWMGDVGKEPVEKGQRIFLDDENGWIWYKDKPIPRNRPVWVITEYLRRCIVCGMVFGKWSLVDERVLFWHPMEVVDIQAPPDFPTNMLVEKRDNA